MGDSWEDDDFTPVLPQAVILPTKAAWEDEDLPEDPNAGKTPEQIAAEAERKKKAEELRKAKAAKDAERAALRRSAEEEAELMAKETPEERALRERKAVERSDHAMADELFGGPGQAGGGAGSRPASSLSLSSSTSSSALGGSKKAGNSSLIKDLKAPGDFASLAKDLAPQFKKAASSKDVTSFVSELLARGAKDPVAVEDLNDLIKNLQSLALEKQRQADANRNKIGQKQKALAAKKREHKATSAKHKELFGDDFDGADAEMDKYYDMEDEFM